MTAIGQHLIADLWDCEGLANPAIIEDALRQAATAARATLLDLNLHHFGPQQGVTGVALLAESHISIHSWPENGYAAVDIFLCGDALGLVAAFDCLVVRLKAKRVTKTQIPRGCQSSDT